ncbi:MAG TPA: protein kinase [Vicinamibacterales bacterium]
MSRLIPSEPDAGRWRRVEEICDAALRMGESERDAYLTDACGADRELRREVEALLAHEHTADGFLSMPLDALAGALVDPPRDLIGKTIAGYEILAKLGEGGMGEVYRARDRRLGRDVAIKVLPASVANDRERLKRFDREARLLASVNHPGIGAIYGVVEDEGMRALVLELIEGATLSETLARGPLKLERALAIAAQTADALDHAHRRGITHRDLKPSNIMTTPSGVKLLDFGIGKWTPTADGAMTRESSLTGAGAIVGTLHYMSPEQLEGRATDARSDIFSFGAVLYEVLSGRRAFDGPSQASIIAAVLEAPTPRLSGFGGPLAPRLDRVVAKCLAKNPDDRWQSAADLADELRWLSAESVEPNGASAATTAVRTSKSLRYTAIAAGAATVVAIALVAANWRTVRVDTPATSIRFPVLAQEGRLADGAFDISPDGSQIAYTTFTATNDVLNLRRLDRFDAVALPTTGFVGSPVFSPDGQWIAFYGGGALRKISTKGDAPPIVLTNELNQPSQLGQTFQLAWRTSDAVFVVSRNQPIRRVAANGGRPETLTTIYPETDVDHHGPEALPSGRAVLFTVHGKRNRFSIAAQDLASGERKTIMESAFSPVYSPTGHLLFGRGSAIMAVAFDERTLEVSRDAVTVVEKVRSDPRSGIAHYRLSKNGTLVFQPQLPPSTRQLMWVDRTGRESAVPVPAKIIGSARLSPDGKQLAFSAEDNDRRDIWIYKLTNGALTRLTQDGDNYGPIWAPDGQSVIYGRDGGSVAHVVQQRLDGAPIETLGSSPDDLWPTDLTSDGQHLIVTSQPPTDEYFLAQLNGGSAEPETLLQKSGFPRHARLSPDGRWLAYAENVANQTEVFVQGYPEPGQRRQVSVEGGNHPVWRRDGRELFFRNGNRVFGVSMDTARGVRLGRPSLLFDRRYLLEWNSYDVAADGRFLMIKAGAPDDTEPKLNVIVNWRDELLSRVPVPQ